MTTRANGPLTGLQWLKGGLNTGRNNPRAILGGAAVLMAAPMVPSIVQLLVHAVLQPGPGATMVIAALTTLLAVFLLGPLVGGYLRIIHAGEQGRPVQPRDIFAPFREGADARRMFQLTLIVMLVYLIASNLLASLMVADLPKWAQQVMDLMSKAKPGTPLQLPPPPPGTGGFLGLGSLLALFTGGVFAVAMGQVALRGSTLGAALSDGIVGTARNLLPLLVLAVLAFALTFAFSLVFLLIAAVVAVIAALVHTSLAMALLVPMYLFFLLVVNVVMFGTMYQLWRDIAGNGADAVADEGANPGRIEV